MQFIIGLIFYTILYSPVVYATPHQPANGKYQFVAIGDYGSDNKGEKAVSELIHHYNPSFIITLGDNNYPNGCWKTIDKNIGKYYHDFIHPYVGNYGQGAVFNRFFPSLGNHDWNAKKKCLKNGILPYFMYFELPNNKRYYVIHKPFLDLFALDSDKKEPDGISVNSEQFKWFVEQIKKSKATFKIVYFHHPPYSSGKHGPEKKMRWPFKELGVDMVLSGHEHNYERLNKDALHYVINGLGGPPSTRGKSRHPDPDSILFYKDHYGFVLFDVSQYHLKMKFINTNDEVIDDLSIIKNNKK